MEFGIECEGRTVQCFYRFMLYRSLLELELRVCRSLGKRISGSPLDYLI